MYQADLCHSNSSLQNKLEKLYTLNRHKAIDLSFRPPYIELLKQLGNPHDHLPPIIHVAGTNGKGSIIAALRAILEASGYRVHSYTSPHLIEFNERINLAGEKINDDHLERLIDEVLDLNNDAQLTFFEITTAIAFKAFTEVESDVVLLEVGMGGRLDCTNIIKKPAVSIINKISYDHTEYLGNTISEILNEKSGIVKKSHPCILGYQNDEFHNKQCQNQIRKICQNNDNTLYMAGTDWKTEINNDTFSFIFKNKHHEYPLPSLKGPHQVQNIGAALSTLEALKHHFPINDQAIQSGLQNIKWPGRMERLDRLKQKIFPSNNIQLWYDGGHNDSAGEALALCVDTDLSTPMHLILGMKADKNSKEFLSPLLKHCASISIVPLCGVGNCVTQDHIEPLLTQKNIRVNSYKDINSSLQKLKQQPNLSGSILICGSFYLAQDIQSLMNKSQNRLN